MSESHPKIHRTDAGPKRLATSVTPPHATATTAPKPTPESIAIAAKREKLRRYAMLAALAVATFVYVGGQRRPIGPSAGTLDVRAIVSAVPADQPAKLKLGTYNIHGCKGTDGRVDLMRIAGMLGGLDFIGLNEVHGPAPWEKVDQATSLGSALHMTPLYAPTEDRWWQAKFGNAFLSKLDVGSWQVIPLERRYGKSFRNLVHIRAKAANGTPLNIVVTHIDRSDDRERYEQLKTVGAYFLALEKPAILMGDMNSDAHDEGMIKLLEGTDIVDALGKVKGFNTPRHIDWILTRGLEVKDAGMSPVGPSDHAHVWAEVTVPAASSKVAQTALPYWLTEGIEYFAAHQEFKLLRELSATQPKVEVKNDGPEPIGSGYGPVPGVAKRLPLLEEMKIRARENRYGEVVAAAVPDPNPEFVPGLPEVVASGPAGASQETYTVCGITIDNSSTDYGKLRDWSKLKRRSTVTVAAVDGVKGFHQQWRVAEAFTEQLAVGGGSIPMPSLRLEQGGPDWGPFQRTGRGVVSEFDDASGHGGDHEELGWPKPNPGRSYRDAYLESLRSGNSFHGALLKRYQPNPFAGIFAEKAYERYERKSETIPEESRVPDRGDNEGLFNPRPIGVVINR